MIQFKTKLLNKQNLCELPEEKCQNPAKPCENKETCLIKCGVNKCKLFQKLSYPEFNKTLFEFSNIEISLS